MTGLRSAAQLALGAHKTNLVKSVEAARAYAEGLDNEDLQNAVREASFNLSTARCMTAMAYDRELDRGGNDCIGPLALSHAEELAEAWFEVLQTELDAA